MIRALLGMSVGTAIVIACMSYTGYNYVLPRLAPSVPGFVAPVAKPIVEFVEKLKP